MKYEEIKIGDVLTCQEYKLTVISKSDEHKVITTVNCDWKFSAWKESELYMLKPVLPEEGLLVSKEGDLIYRTGLTSGYGFLYGEYRNDINNWSFVQEVEWWQPATEEQRTKFVEMLKKECENRGLFEDTKLSECGINNSVNAVNKGIYGVAFQPHVVWNKNGRIFYKGEFATPRKEESNLEQVVKTVQEIGDFTIEQTESGVIILTPITNK